MSTLRRVCRHGRRRPDRGHRWTACSSLREEGGQALIEFALLLPFLVAILLAIVKFGIAVNNQDVLTNAVRVGSRTLAISRGDSDPCGKTARALRRLRGLRLERPIGAATSGLHAVNDM